MARRQIRNRVAYARMAQVEASQVDATADKKKGIKEGSPADTVADSPLVEKINAIDMKHKQSFKKDTPVPPSKNMVKK